MQWPAGIAYIICPEDRDRAGYIADCYKNNRVSMRTEDGAIYHNVVISTETLNVIDFPLEAKELGSCVGFVTEAQRQIPMIFAKFPKADELGQGRENVFHTNRTFQDKTISVNGDVERGVYSMSVDSGIDGGGVRVDINSAEDDASYELQVQGDVIITATKSTRIENQDEFVSEITDTYAEKEKKSVIRQNSERTLITNNQVVMNGDEIQLIHYKGYSVTINEYGVQIDALDQDVSIIAGESTVKLSEKGVNIEAESIALNGSFEVLYNLVPGTPIANVGQIGVSKTVKVG